MLYLMTQHFAYQCQMDPVSSSYLASVKYQLLSCEAVVESPTLDQKSATALNSLRHMLTFSIGQMFHRTKNPDWVLWMMNENRTTIEAKKKGCDSGVSVSIRIRSHSRVCLTSLRSPRRRKSCSGSENIYDLHIHRGQHQP